MDFTKLIISSMMLSDLDEIKEILEKDFDNFWNYQIFKEEITNNNSRCLVARYDDEIVCFACIRIILDEADIMNIVTKKTKRNMGFAKLLLNELITISSEENCKQITLEVNENNISAIHLYEKFNFKQVGLRKNYYNNTENAILMTLNLK